MNSAANAAASLVFGTIATISGFASAVLPAEAEPWKDFAGYGSIGGFLLALWMFLRFLREERQERMAERKADRDHQLEMQKSYAASIERILNRNPPP